jgi:hypothetical protein
MPKPRGKQRWITYLSQKNCDQLGFPEWVDITGFGVGRFGQYDITLSGVRFPGYSNSEVERAPVRDQAFMVRANQNVPLTFPCTLEALLDFVDGPAGQIGGPHFELPEGFRDAASFMLNPTYLSDAASDRSGASDQPLVQVSPEETVAILGPPIQGHPINDLCDANLPLQGTERCVGEPFLSQGPNARAAVAKWVEWQALNTAADFSKVADIAESIRLRAERYGYKSERGKMTVASITKMIPAGLTGGRGKNKGKPTSRPGLIYGKGVRKGNAKPGT